MRKITLEEHKEFGKCCKRLYNLLLESRQEKFNNAKTKTEGKKITWHEEKSIKAILDLKNHLEEIMFKDYPETKLPKLGKDIYYGSE